MGAFGTTHNTLGFVGSSLLQPLTRLTALLKHINFHLLLSHSGSPIPRRKNMSRQKRTSTHPQPILWPILGPIYPIFAFQPILMAELPTPTEGQVSHTGTRAHPFLPTQGGPVTPGIPFSVLHHPLITEAVSHAVEGHRRFHAKIKYSSIPTTSSSCWIISIFIFRAVCLSVL